MTTPYDDALAAVARLDQQVQQWGDTRAALTHALETLEANAGHAALAGEPTAKLADQLSRLQAEIRIADQALAALAEQQHQADIAARLARIVESRQQALAAFQEAAAVRAQVQPQLDAIEAIEGVRFSHPNPRSARLERQAHRMLEGAEHQLFQLPAEVRRQVEAQRALQPTDLDRALHAVQYTNAVDVEQAS